MPRGRLAFLEVGMLSLESVELTVDDAPEAVVEMLKEQLDSPKTGP